MCYGKGNYAAFNKEVAHIKWKEILNPSDHIDRNWGKLYSKLMELGKKIYTKQEHKVIKQEEQT